MGFTVDELARGVEVLVRRLGGEDAGRREGELVRFTAPGEVAIEISPMPEERIRHPVLFPRTLLRLAGERAAVDRVNEKILHYFLRGGG